jgi:hypothetical protein
MDENGQKQVRLKKTQINIFKKKVLDRCSKYARKVSKVQLSLYYESRNLKKRIIF